MVRYSHVMIRCEHIGKVYDHSDNHLIERMKLRKCVKETISISKNHATDKMFNKRDEDSYHPRRWR